MRITLRRAGALTVLLFFNLLSNQAQAQFIAPIRYNEGPGIKLSDSLVFHPGAEVEGRYDSNALYETSNPDAAGFMRFIGHLDLSTLSPQRLTDGDGNVAPQKVSFRGKTAVSFREYLSGNENVKAQRALEVDTGLNLVLFPEGVFSFGLGDDFTRTVQARGAETQDKYSRDTNTASARATLAPGGGRLSFSLGYGLGFDIFEDKDLAGANKLSHNISFGAKWKLLPKTAISLDATETIISYYDRNGGVYGEGTVQPKFDSKPLRIYAGLVGLITPSLSLIAKAGYGNALYSSGPSYNNMLGILELTQQLGPLATVRFGFDHNFQDSMFSNYFTDEKFYLGYDHLIASRVLLHLKGDYRYRSYTGLPANADTKDLKQHVMTLGLGGDYQIKEWVYVGLGYDLQLENKISGPTNLNAIFAPSYTKHQIFAKVGVSY